MTVQEIKLAIRNDSTFETLPPHTHPKGSDSEMAVLTLQYEGDEYISHKTLSEGDDSAKVIDALRNSMMCHIIIDSKLGEKE